MPVYQVYSSWFQRLRQLWPQERLTRVRNMAWLLTGLWVAKSIHLSHMAVHLPWPIQKVSIERRLSRFLHNAAVRALVWYEPVARQLLAQAAAAQGEVHLLVDTISVHARVQVIVVSLAFRRRALPLAWTWVRHKKGHSSRVQQRALLARVRRWIPEGTPVLVVGDSEFGSVALIRQLEAWGWDYVLRQRSGIWVYLVDRRRWLFLEEHMATPGQTHWYPEVRLTAAHRHPCRLVVHWEPGEDKPWFLATSLATPRQALRAYRRRMWTEEMHRDLKSHGFHLDKTHIRDGRVLVRLFLALALLYVWHVAVGTNVIKRGQRYLVDRRHRHTLSVFRIGYDSLKRHFTLGHPVRIRLLPYFK